jgi:hypothetical protein
MSRIFFAIILVFVCTSLNAFAFVIPQTSSHHCAVAGAGALAGRASDRMATSKTTTTKTMMMPSDTEVGILLKSQAHTSAPLLLQELATASSVLLADVQVDVDAETARAEFYFYFFAGSGAGGIGAAQLPRFFRYITENRSLDGVGPTTGGTTLNTGIASLVYPTLYDGDVSKILKKLPSPETIVKKGTSEGYLASLGYVVREDFNRALEGCNPLAKSATFDALTRGTGDALSPIQFQESLEKYKNSKDAFVGDLQAAALTKLSAFSALSFLLAGLAYVIVEDARRGFF